MVKLAAEKAGWGRKLPKGRGLGLAFYYSHSGHFAEVAEVSVSASKKLTVHRVTVAGDIGLVVNPLGAEQQIQGSVMDGLSIVLGQRITMENGAVQQQNFGDYPMMRIAFGAEGRCAHAGHATIRRPELASRPCRRWRRRYAMPSSRPPVSGFGTAAVARRAIRPERAP